MSKTNKREKLPFPYAGWGDNSRTDLHFWLKKQGTCLFHDTVCLLRGIKYSCYGHFISGIWCWINQRRGIVLTGSSLVVDNCEQQCCELEITCVERTTKDILFLQV